MTVQTGISAETLPAKKQPPRRIAAAEPMNHQKISGSAVSPAMRATIAEDPAAVIVNAASAVEIAVNVDLSP